MIKPVVKWRGGKGRMVARLLPLIPKHVCYCEPFAGGLALLFSKPKSQVEVVNDLNGDLVSLYRNLQYHLPELLSEIQFSLNARKNLHEFIGQKGITEIQRAARFLLINRTSFSAGMTSFGVTKTHPAFSRDGLKEILGAAHERLDQVVVENLEYNRCVELYDSKDSFFFLDPPYVDSEIGVYDGFAPEQMERLAKMLRKVKGKWLLTVNDSPANRALFKSYRKTAIVTPNSTAKAAACAKFGELIIQSR